jgi:hypothetical protein
MVSQTCFSICLTIYGIFVNISELSHVWVSRYARLYHLDDQRFVFWDRCLLPAAEPGKPFAYSSYPLKTRSGTSGSQGSRSVN